MKYTQFRFRDQLKWIAQQDSMNTDKVLLAKSKQEVRQQTKGNPV